MFITTCNVSFSRNLHSEMKKKKKKKKKDFCFKIEKWHYKMTKAVGLDVTSLVDTLGDYRNTHLIISSLHIGKTILRGM